MNFKIIDTDSDFPDVLLYLDDLDGKDNVIIQAVGDTPEEPDILKFERIDFPDRQMCRRFIADYTVESANAFCRERDLYYSHPNHKTEE